MRSGLGKKLCIFVILDTFSLVKYTYQSESKLSGVVETVQLGQTVLDKRKHRTHFALYAYKTIRILHFGGEEKSSAYLA
jgi:hypothetical protein